MIAAWFGVLALTAGWLTALPVFEPQLAGTAAWLLAGTILIVIGVRDRSAGALAIDKSGEHDKTGRRFPWSTALVLGVAVIAAFWLRGAFRTAFAILAGAALATLLPLPRRLRRFALPGLSLTGRILVTQAALIPVLYAFSARVHDTAALPFLHDWVAGFPSLPWLTWLLRVPVALLAPGSSATGTTLHLMTPVDTVSFTPTWEKLGLIPLALFFAGGATVLSVHRPGCRGTLARLLGWVAAYAFVRLLFLLFIVAQFRNAEIFWRFEPLLASFAPLPLLLGAWTARMAPRASDRPASTRVPSRIGLAAFALTAGLTLAAAPLDLGVRKDRRILIDEGHGEWESTNRAFDRDWYRTESVYNYYSLAEYWSHWYQVESRAESLTPALLTGYDVLVLKTPTRAYSPDELDAIEGFVREGGGVFIIGDHTNVYGMTIHLNSVARRFGMYFRYDSTYRLDDLGYSYWQRPHRLAHPVTRSLDGFPFATSCTLYAPLLAENVILGYGLRAMHLDYSERGYFPVKEGKVNYDFGLFVQAAAVRRGKGRVLIFTDSTCFSNFALHMPGRADFALGSLDWLNRSNRLPWLPGAAGLLAAAGLMALLVGTWARPLGGDQWNSLFIGGTLGYLIVSGSAAYESDTASWPEPIHEVLEVAFDTEHGSHVVPGLPHHPNPWREFETFFVWTQRLGLVPRNARSLEQALSGSRAVVEIHPNRPFSPEQLDRLEKFVRAGGALVLLESPKNRASTARELLAPFGLALQPWPGTATPVLGAEGEPLAQVDSALEVVGHQASILRTGDGHTVMGWRRHGAGTVVVCGVSSLFSFEHMGPTGVAPDDRQRAIFEVEFNLFEKVLGLVPPRRFAAGGK